MKMSAIHYADLKSRIEHLAVQIRMHRLDLEEQKRNPNPLQFPVKDVERRLLWDAFYASRIQSAYGYQDFDYTDTHIETAMRSIFKELGI